MTWCSYAACDRPAQHRADGWEFCAPHLQAHEREARGDHDADRFLDHEARRKLANYRRSQVARLWRKGWTDAQIARSLGLTRNWVGNIRRSLGLPGHVKVADCGTRSGYSRHRARGEQPCDECRWAQQQYDATYYRTRKRVAA